MMLSCEDAARLASEAEQRELTRGERFSLFLHGKLCRCAICQHFTGQLKELRRAFREFSIRQARGEIQTPGQASLSSEARDKIKAAMKSPPDP